MRLLKVARVVAPLVLVAVLAVAGLLALQKVTGSLNPFAEKTTDRSGPAVLLSIRNIARFEAATGDFQVVVDLEKQSSLPLALQGQRTLFIGRGSVNAYVDFSGLASSAVTVDKTRTTATLRLPQARLEPTTIDPKNSYVFATQTGLFTALFGDTSNDQQPLYILAAQKIQDAAQQSGLLKTADQNTTLMLQSLLTALGFKTVNVTFS